MTTEVNQRANLLSFGTMRTHPNAFLFFFTLPTLEDILTIDNGLFKAIICSIYTLLPPEDNLKIDNGIFQPISVLECGHKTKINQILEL